MSKPAARRFPLAPLLEVAGGVNLLARRLCQAETGAWYDEGINHDPALQRWARLVQRYRVDGVPEPRCDDLALALGYHPLNLWPNLYDALDREATA